MLAADLAADFISLACFYLELYGIIVKTLTDAQEENCLSIFVL